MNTKALQDQAPTTTGRRLRQARENMGLSQQTVAKRLCLKEATVRDIEDDHINSKLVSTFLRGYICSYARMVHISEEELMPIMAKQTPIKLSNVSSMQSFSLEKNRKKRDFWLIGFTWFILFVMVDLTGAWWWQNYQAQKQDIVNMVNQFSIQLSQEDNSTSVPIGNGDDNISQPPATTEVNPFALQRMAIIGTSAPPGASSLTSADSNALVINFTGDCWLEVFDAGAKKLFSGIQYNGATLNLAGKAPYKLTIGAPAAVRAQYQDKPVNLSRFIRSN